MKTLLFSFLVAVTFLGVQVIAPAAAIGSPQSRPKILADKDFQRELQALGQGRDIERPLAQLDAIINRYLSLPDSAGDVSGLVQVGQVLSQINRMELAGRYGKRAEALDSDHLGMLLLMGWVRFNQASIEESHAYYGKAVTLYPKSPQTHYNLGHSLGALKRHEESIASFEKACQLKSNVALFHFSLAEAYEKTQLREKALASFQRVLALTAATKDRAALLNRQKSYWNIGKLMGTKALGLQRQGGDASEIEALNQGAEDHFQAALKMMAKDPDARTEYAIFLIKNNRFEDAIGLLKAAVKDSPSHRWAHYQLGVALLRTGDRSQGTQMMAKFRELQAEFEKKEFEHLLTKVKGLRYKGQ